MNQQPDPKMVVNPTLSSSELLDELAARLQQLYGSLDTLAVRTEAEGLELVYDALWAMLEDVYQIQAIRDALEDRLAGAGQAEFPGDTHDVKH